MFYVLNLHKRNRVKKPLLSLRSDAANPLSLSKVLHNIIYAHLPKHCQARLDNRAISPTFFKRSPVPIYYRINFSKLFVTFADPLSKITSI